MHGRDLVHHGLAIKRNATADTIAEFTGLSKSATKTFLERAVETGRATLTGETYVLTPLARVALDGRYSLYYAHLREDPAFVRIYKSFEQINVKLKQIVTDWQTITVGGQKIANRHDDSDYDDVMIERLGAHHEAADPILSGFVAELPRYAIYQAKLLNALQATENGEIAWFSDIRRESYHTVWFELHEDILRVMGRERQE